VRGKLDLLIEPVLRVEMLQFLARITDYTATLTLMKGRARGAIADRWSYGAYGPENLRFVEPELAKHGHPLLYELDWLVVAIPQFHLLPELEGKLLASGPTGHLVVVEDRRHDV
jgi:hypothetical protein